MDRIYSPFEVKIDGNGDDDGTISGYGSTFGNIDTYGDTVAPGAFQKTIADAQNGNGPWPAMLSQHGSSDQTPIGIWTGMSEDSRGLRLKGKLAINTKRGADTYNLLKMKPRPALNGLSIGYVAKDFEIHRTGPVKRTLKAVDLKEISLVTFPADKFSTVRSVKSWGETEVDEAALMRKMAAQDWERMRRVMNLNGR
jgi:uncharacterized protein